MELINIQVKFFSFIHISTDYCFFAHTHTSFFFPVYSVFPSSLLSFTMEKILASEFTLSLFFCVIQIDVHINSYFYIANAHRVFVTKELTTTSPVMSPTAHSNLTGIVSIVDSAFLFFHLPPPQKTIGPPLLLTLVIFFLF